MTEHERLVDALVDPSDILFGNPRLQPKPQPEADVGVFGGIFGGRPQRDLVERDLLGTRPAQLFERDALVVEVRLGELLEAVAEALPRVEVEAHDHRVVDRRDVDPRLVEHHPVVLEIVPDLEHRRVLQQRLQLR